MTIFTLIPKKATLESLAKVALFGSVAVAFTGYAVQKNLERHIRATITYKRALDILHNHTSTINHLGIPIKEGRVTVNHSEEIRKMKINLKGSNTSGQLNCEYIVNPDQTTHIKKVEVQFKDVPKKIFVIHEI